MKSKNKWLAILILIPIVWMATVVVLRWISIAKLIQEQSQQIQEHIANPKEELTECQSWLDWCYQELNNHE